MTQMTSAASEQFLGILGSIDRHYFDDIGANRLLDTFRVFSESYTGGPVLEIGSWPGDFAVCLKRLGYDISGIDIDPARAADRFARERIRVERCDVERDALPFRDQSFEYIFLTEVIEHLYADPLYALAELRRVLRPGGRMLVSTPNLTRWENRVLFALGRPLIFLDSPLEAFSTKAAVGHMGHLRLFSPPELRAMLTETGFRYCHGTIRRSRASRGGGRVQPPRADAIATCEATRSRRAALSTKGGRRLCRSDRRQARPTDETANTGAPRPCLSGYRA